jgi:hypothetical protein
MEKLMKKLTEHLTKIVDMKKELMNNDLRQKQAFKAVQDDRQLRLDQE